MATIKYFSGETQLSSIRYFRNEEFAERFPGVPGKRVDGFSKLVGWATGRMIDGMELPVTRVIEYKNNPSLHKCDSRCRNAKGKSCECSCGGQFHGAQ